MSHRPPLGQRLYISGNTVSDDREEFLGRPGKRDRLRPLSRRFRNAPRKWRKGRDMTRDVTLTAIDVGSAKVLTLIGRRNEWGRAEVLGAGLAPAAGIRKGVVVDAGEARESVRASLADARNAAGVSPASAVVTVSGVHLEGYLCWGTLHSMRQNAPLTTSELARAVDAAHPVDFPPRKQLLHKLPRSYAVDGLRGVRNPLGMHALRLEAETVCMAGDAASVGAAASAVEAARLRVEAMVAAPIAAAEAVLTNDEIERGVVLMDIGGGVTTIAVYHQGSLWNAGVLPLGGNQFTSDLSVALNVSYETAEEIKVGHGQAALDLMGDEAVVVEDAVEGRMVRVERRTIARYLHDRAGELFRLAALKLNGFYYPNLPPAGLVLTGGGSRLRGIERVARQVLGSPVRFGCPEDPALPYDLRDPTFSAGVGALNWAAMHPRPAQLVREEERRVKFDASYAQANAGPLSWLKNRMSGVAS